MSKGECCSSFGERICSFISKKTSMTRDPLEAWSYKRESERTQIFLKDFGWRNTTGNRYAKGPIESGMFSDGSDTIPGHVPVQGTQPLTNGHSQLPVARLFT